MLATGSRPDETETGRAKPGKAARQSRLMSLVEAIANVVVGLVVAVATQIVAFPLLGLQASLEQNVGLALIFTIVSIGRSFLLRRLFEELR